MMKKYVGETCPVCGKKFTPEDDIVVCPDCGTPHHRGCYAQLGHCAHQDKHGEGWKYGQKAEGSPRPEEPQPRQGIVCNRCGTVNDPDGLFCVLCGNDLIQNQGGPAGNGQRNDIPNGVFRTTSTYQEVRPDATIDDIPVKDFAAYLGSNQGYFIPKFEKFANNRPVSFNFCALIFPQFYYLYRKMYGLGILFLILDLLGSVLTMIGLMEEAVANPNHQFFYLLNTISTVIYYIMFAARILSGIFFNRLYYWKACRAIRRCQKECSGSPQQLTVALMRRGSVSTMAVGIALVAMMVCSTVVVYSFPFVMGGSVI